MQKNGRYDGQVESHARMRAFLQHRQRVMEAKPRVNSQRSRSISQPRLNNWKEKADHQRIQAENERLLDRLIKITNRKSELGPSPNLTTRSRSLHSQISTIRSMSPPGTASTNSYSSFNSREQRAMFKKAI